MSAPRIKNVKALQPEAFHLLRLDQLSFLEICSYALLLSFSWIQHLTQAFSISKYTNYASYLYILSQPYGQKIRLDLKKNSRARQDPRMGYNHQHIMNYHFLPLNHFHPHSLHIQGLANKGPAMLNDMHATHIPKLQKILHACTNEWTSECRNTIECMDIDHDNGAEEKVGATSNCFQKHLWSATTQERVSIIVSLE